LSRFYQQKAQEGIALLVDVAELLPPAAAVLARNQPVGSFFRTLVVSSQPIYPVDRASVVMQSSGARNLLLRTRDLAG
jgi:hypothetical protein